MEGTDARILKKAVVSLQKLDMSFQGSSFLSREMLTDSGGSEKPPADNIGCTDDDDLEKKIQAFSIPVKPDELPAFASKSLKKPNGKDSISLGKKLTEFKSDKTQPPSSTSTKVKDKVSHGKNSSETVKQHSKTVSDKEKLSHGKSAKDKVSSDLHKISTIKDHEVKKPKSEHEKKSSRTWQDDATSKEKSLKRKSSVDHKSREPQEKLIKFEKKEKQSERDKPSSSKSNTSHSKSHDSKGHIKTVPLKKVTKHDDNKSASNKVKVTKDGVQVERRESHKMKEGVKEVKKSNKDLKKEDKTVLSTTSKVIDSKNVTKNNEKSVLSDAKKRPILRRQSSSNSLIEKKMKLKVHSESSSESHKKDIKKEVGSNGKVVSKRVVGDVNKNDEKVFKKPANIDRNGKRNDVKERTGRHDTEKQIKNGKVIKKTHSTNSSQLKKVSRLREEKKSSSHKFEKLESQKNFDKKKHGSERNEKSRERKGEGSVKQKKNNKKSVNSSGKRKAVVHSQEDMLNSEVEELQPNVHLTERLFLSKPLFKTFSKKSDRFPSQNVGTEAYKKIWKWSHYIRMPSAKWSLHKHPKGDFVIILHVSEINPLHKIIIDKHVMFCKTALPVVKLYDKEVSTLQTAKELQTLGEVCAFLKNIDNLSVCESLRKSIVVGSNGKCGLYTSSKVTLPYTCQHCSRMKASAI